MKKLFFLLLTLALILALVPAGMAKKPAPKLSCTIDYLWFGDHWEGTISGDIDGYIVWPSGSGPPKFVGQTAHYGGEFEIYVDDSLSELLLAGDGAGSTTIRHGKNSVWRSNGTVTDAGSGLEDWIGRHVHQDGHFTWAAPGVPEAGSGTFRVN